MGLLASPHEAGDYRVSTQETARDPILPFVLIAAGLLLAAALSLNVVRTAYGIKGDEASYVTMALSVAHDGDLAFERRDLLRFWRVYGRGPDGIFLKRSSGRELSVDRRWPFVHVSRTSVVDPDRLYFGKAFIYSLIAAPFVKLFGLNGLWVLHVLLLVGVVVAGATFAATRMPRPAAWLVACGFIGGSIVPLYSIWLTSEIFNFSLVFFGYFVWLYKEVRATPGQGAAGLLRGSRSDLAAAALLGLATFSKLSNVLLVLPLIGLALWRKRMLDALGVGVVFAAVVLGGFGTNAIVSGEWNYQGGDRKTFSGRFPFEAERANFDELGVGVSTNEIAAREPSRTYLTQFGHNVVYLFAGRHFGLLPYFFPGMFIAAWAFRRRRTLAVWHAMIAVVTVATAFGLLVMLPNTWSGGGGPAGNRYFLSAYPTLFFLVPPARSMAPGIVAWLGGLLFVAHILVDPFVSVKRPWLNADRGLLRALPVELTMINDLPVMLDQGRSRIRYGRDPELLLYFLDDRAARPNASGIWVSGQSHADLIVLSDVRLAALEVELRSPVGDRVTLAAGGASRTVDLDPGRSASIRLPVRSVYARSGYGFVLSVITRNGFVPHLRDSTNNDGRYLGVALQMTGVPADAVPAR